MTDQPITEATLNAQRERYLAQLRDDADAVSDPTDRTEPAPDQIATADSIIYAWQMLNAEGTWNIIGIGTPMGASLPLVTTSFAVAWEAFTIAQEHANVHKVQCRLASFRFDDLMAVVEPEVDRGQ